MEVKVYWLGMRCFYILPLHHNQLKSMLTLMRRLTPHWEKTTQSLLLSRAIDKDCGVIFCDFL